MYILYELENGTMMITEATVESIQGILDYDRKVANADRKERYHARYSIDAMDFEGIQIAMPNYEAVLYPQLGTSLSKRHTGDVVFMLEPGWQLMQDDKHAVDFVVDDNPTSPVMLWSGTIRPMPQEELDATDVAELIFQ